MCIFEDLISLNQIVYVCALRRVDETVSGGEPHAGTGV